MANVKATKLNGARVTQVDSVNDAILVPSLVDDAGVASVTLWGGNVATTGNVCTGTAFTALNIGTGMGSGDTITIGSTSCATNVDGDMTVAGDLTVNGTTTTVDSDQVNIADHHTYQNSGYTTVAAQAGGVIVNYLPTATTDTSAAGGFASTSTVNTTGAATFSAGDLIQISGATDPTNNGLFEVLTHAANLLTIDTSPTIDGPATTFAVDTTDTTATITQVNVSIIRAGTDGVWETGAGSSTTGFTFSDLATAAGQTWTQVLSTGATSGGTDPTISTGDELVGAVELTLRAGTGDNDFTAVGGAGSASKGGDAFLNGGLGDGANAGGVAEVRAGQGGATGTGGAAHLVSGAGGATSGDSGNVNIDVGSVTSGTPGDINIGLGLASAIAEAINLGAVTTTTLRMLAVTAAINDQATAATTNIGTGAAAQTTTLGSGNTTSTTAVNGGSGGITGTASDGDVALTASGLTTSTGTRTASLTASHAGVASGDDSTVNISAIGNNANTVNIFTDNAGTVNIGDANTGKVTINPGQSTVEISTNADATTVSVGTGAAAKTVTLGSNNTTSTTTIDSGSGGMTLDADGTLTVDAEDNASINVAGNWTLLLDETQTADSGTAGNAYTVTTGIGAAAGATNPGGTGGNLHLFGGAGGAASASNNDGGAGAEVHLRGGAGGAGDTGQTGGTGGEAILEGGAGGAAGAGTQGLGGDVTIRGGTGSTAGTVDIGETQTSGVNLMGGTATGTVAIGNAAAGALTMDTAAGISMDAATASNLTVSGASADLTLGARGSSITLNESGDTALSGFTATSIVGALNELKSAGVAEAAQVVVTDLATTGLDSGAPVYISGADTASHTDADAEGTSNFVGFVKTVGAAGTGEIVASGIALAAFEGGLSGYAAGNPVYLATTAGRVTFNEPTGSGDTVYEVGYLVNTTGLTATTVDGETAEVFISKGQRSVLA